MTKRLIATHNGSFHTDDVFGVATLLLHFGENNCEVVRTRDEKIINRADIVLDVGGEYDESRDRFDHHQIGGAGARDNGIPYASFGLIWKKYGPSVSGSKEVAAYIDHTFIQPIDAADNGVDLSTPLREDVHASVGINYLTSLFKPTWRESQSYDESFAAAMRWVIDLLRRVVVVATDELEAIRVIQETYAKSADSRLVVFEEKQAFGREVILDALMKQPEVLYAVVYHSQADLWHVIALNEKKGSYKVRKALPELWAGKHDKELADVTGVPDAVFCHRIPFMAVAKSKEGALKLAQLALEA